MFRSLLIANRGEIARRVMRTCRRLGIRTIAVYSDADRGAAHVADSDQAVRIGPAPARASYLDIAAIVAAARACGAEAVHPGYGFLSENADFAEACGTAGLTFVGPPAAAIRTMGSKAAAKVQMIEAGVAVIPGYHGAAQDIATLSRAAAEIGYPVLVKPASGGGGKGMRVVRHARDLAEEIAASKREAASSVGEDTLIIERYLDRPRHVEVQIFADRAGNIIHLFERDCSIQRRHQKVIEEAPAPGIAPATRAAMGAAAVAAARAVGYVGAGTVEFLMDQGGGFYFIEMNTRLQVEHAVTEMITGLDLVEWQLVVAAGGELPLGQDSVAIAGHAIEARLYAEDLAADFRPAAGVVSRLRLPAEGPRLRIDCGLREGDAVSVYYDPMIAKLIVHGADRADAVTRLGAALDAIRVAGIETNAALLAAVARHPDFAGGRLDTLFLDRHAEQLMPRAATPPDAALALAALQVLRSRAAPPATPAGDPYSPWLAASGWRLNAAPYQEVPLRFGERRIAIGVRGGDGGLRLELPGGEIAVSLEAATGEELTARLDGRRIAGTAIATGDDITIFMDARSWRFHLADAVAIAEAFVPPPGRLIAALPGTITAIMVAPGAHVAAGAALVTLEAMKVEHTIRAPAIGRVGAVHVAVGDQVKQGVELVSFEADGDG